MHPKKKHVLLALAIASIGFGFADAFFFPYQMTPPTAIIFTVVMCFLIFAWYHMDSSQRGYKRSVWLNIGVIGLSLVALPYYFFRSRGAKNGALATALALATLIGIGVLNALGGAAAYSLQG